jgi:hypothetical protein
MKPIKIFFVFFYFFFITSTTQAQLKSPLVDKFVQDGDTLSLYVKKSNCDTVLMMCYKIYKDRDVYRVVKYSNVVYILKNRCKNLPNKADQEIYTKQRRYSFPLSSVDKLKEVERLVRTKTRKFDKCEEKFQYTLFLKGKRFVSKQKPCGNDILTKFQGLLVGELEEDNNNLIRE